VIEIREVSGRVKEAGAYRMTPGNYHGDPCPEPSLSRSTANILLAQSPLHAWTNHPRLNPACTHEPGNVRMALGEACHRLLLGQGATIARIPFANYRTKAAQAAKAEALAAGMIPMIAERDEADPDEMTPLELAEAIVEAARAQLPAGLIDESGDAEVAVVAQDAGGIWTRSLLDWWSADRLTIVDYKTARTASPIGFGAHAAQNGYDMQAAFYRRAVGRAFPELAGRVRFLFAVQEIEPPYALCVFEIAEADIFVADRKVEWALHEWALCLRGGKWRGYPTGIQRIMLPEWHAKRFLESELEESESRERGASWQFAGERQ
jgi:hypothetical protein